MDPATIMQLTIPVVKTLSTLLTDRAKRSVAVEAQTTITTAEDPRTRVRGLFDRTKDRLQVTWVIGISMTIVLFALFVTMVVAAIVTGIIAGNTTYPIVFGGVGAASLLTVIIWKPFERAFQAAITVQRLEIILVGLEEQWTTCSRLDGADKQGLCVREASDAALTQMAKLS